MVNRYPDGRRGGTKFGCLITLALLVAAIYVGILFGRPWFRYQRWNDEIRTVAGFASAMPDSAMRARLEAQADSLRLPPGAKRKLSLKRLTNPARMEIRSEYTEKVVVPIVGEKVLTFKPFGEAELWSWDPTATKERTLEAAIAWRKGHAGPVVFTNGVFDLLHAGHVAVLEAARALGGGLIVGLNDDDSVRALAKGPERPIRPVADRARTVAAFAAVDCVVVFAEPTPLALIEALTPDVLVKGGDYDPDTVVGADLVRARGGRVVIVPLLPNLSTSRLVERLRVPS